MKVWIIYSDDDGPEEMELYFNKEAAIESLYANHNFDREIPIYDELINSCGYYLVEKVVM